MNQVREFTLRELASFNGEEGSPVYIAFGGKVYDVTGSSFWRTGTHLNRHAAGTDLTDQLGSAPHGTDVFEREGVEQVGVLIDDPFRVGLPGPVNFLLRKLPVLRRHIHPPTVHFPIAFIVAASLFMVLHLLAPGALGLDFEELSFVMLILGALFTPLTVGTGFFTWWVNYRLVRSFRVRNLIVLSVLLVIIEVAALALRFSGSVDKSGMGTVYYGLVLLAGPIVMLMGYNGGQLVFPTHTR